MKAKTNGFTIVELIITILIVGILALIAVPVYRGYVRKSMSTEGKNLLSDIGVDARRNKYFKSYSIAIGSAQRFTATTSFSGKTITLIGSITGKPEIIDNYSNQED